MNDFYIPSVNAHATELLRLYFNKHLPNHKIDFNVENGDITVYEVTHDQNERLNTFIDIINGQS